MKDIIKLELNPCESEIIVGLLMRAGIECMISRNKDMEKTIEGITDKFSLALKEEYTNE